MLGEVIRINTWLVQETEHTILKCDISCVYLESIVIVLLQTKRKM